MNTTLSLSIFFFQISITTFFLASSGFLFRKIVINSNHQFKFEEDGLFGFILIGFLSVLFNFFLPLNSLLNSIIFLAVLILSFFFGIVSKLNKKLLKKILITSLIAFLLIIYSNVNRPDAWLYHLPYSKIINEHKIIIGIANVHSRFAHISIFQYISSFFNNYFLFKNGVLIPIALVASFFFMFAYKEFAKNFKLKPYRIYSYVVFLLLVFSLYAFNRYSEYGNDAQAHLFYFLFFILLLKSTIKENYNEVVVIELFFLSLFLFLIKPTFVLVSLIPFILFLKNKKKDKIYKSISFLIYCSFLTIWLIKNILTNGCLIYPLNITCSEKFFWKTYDIQINASENEAWSKGWPDFNSDNEINQLEYSKNFNWVETWLENHFLFIIKKIIPIVIFLLLNFLILYFTKSLKKNLYDKTYFYIFLFTVFFLLVWFIKFPLYRLGISQIFTFLLLLSYLLFIQFINTDKLLTYFKPLKFFLLFILFIVISKNLLRINDNSDNSILPSVYFSNETNVTKIYNDKNIFTHYKPPLNNLCGYLMSPCTHLSKKISVTNYWSYTIYYKE